MERTHSQIWNELRENLEKFTAISEDGKTPAAEIDVQAAIVDRLVRELNVFENAHQKAA